MPRIGVNVSHHQLRVPDFAKRLTAQIANTINEVLKPQGVAVVVEAIHGCMTTRGVHKSSASLVTSRMLGVFRRQAQTRQEFLAALDLRGAGATANALM